MLNNNATEGLSSTPLYTVVHASISTYYSRSHKMKGTAHALFRVANSDRMCYEIMGDHAHNIGDHAHNSGDHAHNRAITFITVAITLITGGSRL